MDLAPALPRPAPASQRAKEGTKAAKSQ
jgi:hypothetical protein